MSYFTVYIHPYTCTYHLHTNTYHCSYTCASLFITAHILYCSYITCTPTYLLTVHVYIYLYSSNTCTHTLLMQRIPSNEGNQKTDVKELGSVQRWKNSGLIFHSSKTKHCPASPLISSSVLTSTTAAQTVLQLCHLPLLLSSSKSDIVFKRISTGQLLNSVHQCL